LSTSRLLLAGVALGIICSALMTWAVYFSTSFDLRQLMYWMMGGFGGVDWQQLWLMLALLPVLLIGLVIPHILRLCGLSDHRVLLPACLLAGASALLGADIIARLALSAAELPIGVVTATLGAPVFI
ncbi:vitamin B12 ABC transporter permease BtuC, partial [Klebsiella aerogenes]